MTIHEREFWVDLGPIRLFEKEGKGVKEFPTEYQIIQKHPVGLHRERHFAKAIVLDPDTVRIECIRGCSLKFSIATKLINKEQGVKDKITWFP